MTSELIASKELTENDLAITWRMQFPNERTEGEGGGGYFDIQSVISRVIKSILHDKTPIALQMPVGVCHSSQKDETKLKLLS